MELNSQLPLLVVVCDADAFEETVRASCGLAYRIARFARSGLVDSLHGLSAHGRRIVEAAREADVVLVEWVMDEAPALNVLCYNVRRHLSAPVLMAVTGDADEQSAGIAAGADDALLLPLSPAYVQAQVFSYRRLVQAVRADLAQAAPSAARHVQQFGALRVDGKAHRFYVHEAEVELTPREFALIHYLVTNADMLCTRDQILDHVWGITFDTGTNMVDVYMYFLRKKLEAYGLKGMIETVRGKGYRLVGPD